MNDPKCFKDMHHFVEPMKILQKYGKCFVRNVWDNFIVYTNAQLTDEEKKKMEFSGWEYVENDEDDYGPCWYRSI